MDPCLLVLIIDINKTFIMATYNLASLLPLAFLLATLMHVPTRVRCIGVCFGRNGNNLPSVSDTINLYKSNHIDSMRLYSPDHDVIEALRGTGINLIVGVDNGDLQALASSDLTSSYSWVYSNIVPYASSVAFRYIAVGNEVIPEPSYLAQAVLPAMRNIRSALSAAGLDHIKVSTSVSGAVLGQSYPPSNGAFSPAALQTLQPIVAFLAEQGSPLLANVYPYFSYISNERDISIQYALFTAAGAVVSDPPYNYQNLFDASVDAMYAALERANGGGVRIVVSESGWPSAGGEAATMDNARTYNQNLIRHVGGGTPRKPGAIETYLFAMFNENLKQGMGTENNFGLFYPDQQPVYQISYAK